MKLLLKPKCMLMSLKDSKTAINRFHQDIKRILLKVMDFTNNSLKKNWEFGLFLEITMLMFQLQELWHGLKCWEKKPHYQLKILGENGGLKVFMFTKIKSVEWHGDLEDSNSFQLEELDIWPIRIKGKLHGLWSILS